MEGRLAQGGPLGLVPPMNHYPYDTARDDSSSEQSHTAPRPPAVHVLDDEGTADGSTEPLPLPGTPGNPTAVLYAYSADDADGSHSPGCGSTPQDHVLADAEGFVRSGGSTSARTNNAHDTRDTSTAGNERVDSGVDGEGCRSDEQVEAPECRICLDTEVQDSLVVPCICSGSLKWAHIGCLEKWILERGSLSCEICKTRYKEDIVDRIKERVSFQDLSHFLEVLHRSDANAPLTHSRHRLGAFLVALDIPSERWVTDSVRVFNPQRGAQEGEELQGSDTMEAYGRRLRFNYWLKTLLLLLLTIVVLYLMMFLGSRDDSSFWAMVLLRAMSFLLSVYLVARVMSSFRRRGDFSPFGARVLP